MNCSKCNKVLKYMKLTMPKIDGKEVLLCAECGNKFNIIHPLEYKVLKSEPFTRNAEAYINALKIFLQEAK